MFPEFLAATACTVLYFPRCLLRTAILLTRVAFEGIRQQQIAGHHQYQTRKLHSPPTATTSMINNGLKISIASKLRTHSRQAQTEPNVGPETTQASTYVHRTRVVSGAPLQTLAFCS